MNTCERVEDCIGQIVDCHDGAERRIEAACERFIEYSVQIAPGTWMRLSPTRRGAVEKDFIGAPIVDPATPQPAAKTLEQIAAEEGMKVLESDNAALRRQLEKIWSECRVVYYFQNDKQRPIDHRPYAGINNRAEIEDLLGI